VNKSVKFPSVDTALLAGTSLGAGAVFLTLLGNPVNSGICISCFLENLAGALRLHGSPRMSYIRPELIGFLLGSFFMAHRGRRFRVTGGSSPLLRFFLGFFMIVGCAVFIGCPIKLILRLAAGDLTAVAALFGLVFGIWLGTRYIRAGVALDRAKNLPQPNGYILPLLSLLLLAFLLLNPGFLQQGSSGPAARHAPILVSLAVGLLIGALAQHSGFCITGGIRNLLLVNEKTLFYGVVATLISALMVSLLSGHFHFGLDAQPASHLSHGWSFLAMTLVGLAAVLVDGCPFRQVIRAGQGDVDAGITCFGMLTGGAFAVGWLMRSTSAGPTFNGKIGVLAGLIFCLTVVLALRPPTGSGPGNRRN